MNTDQHPPPPFPLSPLPMRSAPSLIVRSIRPVKLGKWAKCANGIKNDCEWEWKIKFNDSVREMRRRWSEKREEKKSQINSRIKYVRSALRSVLVAFISRHSLHRECGIFTDYLLCTQECEGDQQKKHKQNCVTVGLRSKSVRVCVCEKNGSLVGPSAAAYAFFTVFFVSHERLPTQTRSPKKR